jgi:nitrogen regulatory protein PII
MAQIFAGVRPERIGMKMITAIIQPFRLDHVHAALCEAGILGVNVTECCGYGHQHGLTAIHWEEEYINTLVPKVMLQLAVPVDQVQNSGHSPVAGEGLQALP